MLLYTAFQLKQKQKQRPCQGLHVAAAVSAIAITFAGVRYKKDSSPFRHTSIYRECTLSITSLFCSYTKNGTHLGDKIPKKKNFFFVCFGRSIRHANQPVELHKPSKMSWSNAEKRTFPGREEALCLKAFSLAQPRFSNMRIFFDQRRVVLQRLTSKEIIS